jgi:hypothetical protein
MDMTGVKIGMLSVINRAGSKKGGKATWNCECECGNSRVIIGSDLRNGKYVSCGCAKKTHGMTKTTEFRIWTDMKRRCNNPNRPDYKNYGGRGIKVCDDWSESFESFLMDMGNRPKGKTLDRKDNEGPYDKHNCVWSTYKEQGRNTRFNVRYEVFGALLTMPELSEKYGIKEETIRSRIKLRGWDIAKAVTEPVRSCKKSQNG